MGCHLEKVSKSCLISVLTEILVGFTMDTTSKENQHDTDTIGGKIHFALGEMGTQWGVNRTVAQIHALLFIAARPMAADEICETLGVARSNVSNSIKELQSWRLVSVVHQLGDRRDHFETNGDVWELFRVIAAERQRREIEPTERFLTEMMASPEFAQQDKEVQRRITQTHELISTLTVWTSQMLKLSTATLVRLLKLGSSIQKFLK